MAVKLKFRPEENDELDSGQGQIDPSGGRAYKQAEDVAAQSGANAGDAKREYSHGTMSAKKGKAKVHRGEIIRDTDGNVRQVKKTAVQTLKGHEQIIPAAPQSKWNKVGISMDDHLKSLGLA